MNHEWRYDEHDVCAGCGVAYETVAVNNGRVVLTSCPERRWQRVRRHVRRAIYRSLHRQAKLALYRNDACLRYYEGTFLTWRGVLRPDALVACEDHPRCTEVRSRLSLVLA